MTDRVHGEPSLAVKGHDRARYRRDKQLACPSSARLGRDVTIISLAFALLIPCLEAADLYVCDSPKKGRVGSPTIVKPGEDCPSELGWRSELAIDVELDAPVDLQLEVVFAGTTDHFGLPRDLELIVSPGASAEQQRHSVFFDAAPYGEGENEKLLTLIPARWLAKGRNQIALSLRQVDFPGVTFRLSSARLSTDPIEEVARRDFDAALGAAKKQREKAEAIERKLREELTSAPYRVAVEHSLHKLFQDEVGLVLRECQDAVRGRPWSLRRSHLVGNFLPSLLGSAKQAGSSEVPTQKPELILAACRNERESGQVVVVPCAADLHRVDVRCSDLRGPDGSSITADNVEIRVVGYVNTKPPRYDHEYLGWWPDVLLPNFPVNVFVGQVQPVWVTVYVPPGARPGDYVGAVRVTPTNQEPIEIPLKLHVWDFELPREPFLQTAVELYTGWIWRFYQQHPESNEDGLPPMEIYLNFLRSMLEHRLSPYSLGKDPGLIAAKIEGGRRTWDYSRFDRAMEFAMSHGLTRFAAGQAADNSLALVERQEETIDLYAHLIQKGWYDRAYYYGIDEGYGDIPRIYALAKRLLPGVRTLTTTTHRDEKLEDVLDIYVPRTVDDWGAYYSRGVPERLKQMGKEYWVYTSGFPPPPVWPQVYVDCPAIDHRIIPWTCARWGLTGYLKVPLTSWYHMEREKMNYQNVRTAWDVNPGIYGDSNGEILMLYCGPNGQMMPSLRLAVLRDGVDDYDYHTILSRYADRLRAVPAEKGRDVLQQAEAALDLSSLIIKPFQFPRRPYVEKLFAHRRCMAEAIVAAKQALGAKEDPTPPPPPSWRRGPLWCAAVQTVVNNVRPEPVTLALVNQSGGAFSASLRASGPKGWRLEPDSWDLEFEKGGLRRIHTTVVLDENAEVSEGESDLVVSARAGSNVSEFKVPIIGIRCRGFRTIGPFKPVLAGTSLQPLPPEKGIDLDGAYTGATGKTVRWQDLLLPYEKTVIDFDRIYGTPPSKYVPQSPKENFANVAFALSFVHAEKARNLLLKFDGPNRMRAWLNGKPVFGGVEDELGALDEEDEGDGGGIGIDISGGAKGASGAEVMGPSQKEVSLVAGWNALLVRVEKSIGKVVGDWSVGIELQEQGQRAEGLFWRLVQRTRP